MVLWIAGAAPFLSAAPTDVTVQNFIARPIVFFVSTSDAENFYVVIPANGSWRGVVDWAPIDNATGFGRIWTAIDWGNPSYPAAGLYGPVWSGDAAPSEQATTVYVGVGQPNPLLFESTSTVGFSGGFAWKEGVKIAFLLVGSVLALFGAVYGLAYAAASAWSYFKTAADLE